MCKKSLTKLKAKGEGHWFLFRCLIISTERACCPEPLLSVIDIFSPIVSGYAGSECWPSESCAAGTIAGWRLCVGLSFASLIHTSNSLVYNIEQRNSHDLCVCLCVYMSIRAPCLWFLIRLPGQWGWPNLPGEGYMPLSPSPLYPPPACLGSDTTAGLKQLTMPLFTHPILLSLFCSAVYDEGESKFTSRFNEQNTQKWPV